MKLSEKKSSRSFFQKKHHSKNLKAAVKKTRHLRDHRYEDSLSTIGYAVKGILDGRKFKEPTPLLKQRVGGKAAGLLEMARLGVMVPPAFNLSTDLCGVYLARRELPENVWKQTEKAMHGLESALRKKFGSSEKPLLVSVRSGARVSMPGMMDTILNLGLNSEIVKALELKEPHLNRFWWDCYRRLIQMYSQVVLGVEHHHFHEALEAVKTNSKITQDSELSVEALRDLSNQFLEIVSSEGKVFPQNPWDQLKGAIEAVFLSWNTERAKHYRKISKIPESWGTSVTVQSMVFGNRNEQSGTGVVFTRDPSTGENIVYGEFLLNAQGEDVVAGIRTPRPIAELTLAMPKTAKKLYQTLSLLEKNFRDVQDVEFTIEDKELYILQTRSAKRSAGAALQHALQFVKEKKITKDEALFRLADDQVKQLLHPSLVPTDQKPIVKGLPASPGAVSGLAVFDQETAVHFARAEQKVILVRRETSPEDVIGMSASEGILTSTGGMTSHAAVVGRGMGKPCVVGCSELLVDEHNKTATVGREVIREGSMITMNGSTGEVYLGALPTKATSWGEDAKELFAWADLVSSMPVLANADTPEQASVARELGAKGIGLCRTEHMFFEPARLRDFRLMILSDSEEERKKYLESLLPYQRDDFAAIFKAMKDLSICVRLLDPPLHEFLPSIHDQKEIDILADLLGLSSEQVISRIQQRHETNPMLGHRGCRLAITFPEIYEMQVRALAEALTETLQSGTKLSLKIMIPLVMNPAELSKILDGLKRVFNQEINLQTSDIKLLKAARLSTKWGTMIELPRACLIADQIAPLVDFISFGTNDLTQTTLGISRDDSAHFIPSYLEQGLLASDPFVSIDQDGVGQLVKMAVEKSRAIKSNIEVGVCGEHGGDPESIKFFGALRFDSISCSPYRVPLARLARARVDLELLNLKKGGTKKR